MQIVEIPTEGYERVVRADDPERGFCAMIAVHSTRLGPSLGGLRMWNYAGGADEALVDVLRLARGMTYKSAVARTGLGGGKSVIVGDAKKDKSEDLLLWMGRFVDSLQGKYLIAEDVGISVYDIDVIAKETRYVSGRAREVGGSGDPSPFTALGVFCAIQESLKRSTGSDSMAGRRIAVQGLGHVGYWLTKHLSEAGAKLVVADIDAGRVERAQREFQAEVVGVDQIVGTECDVFAPCALGAVINDESVSQIQAGVICGAANNQLLRLEHADQLRSRGILYAPDYVVNAGGVINISEEWADGGYDEERATSRVKAVRESLAEVFDYAEQNSVTTAVAADRVAERILQDGGDHSLEQCGR